MSLGGGGEGILQLDVLGWGVKIISDVQRGEGLKKISSLSPHPHPPPLRINIGIALIEHSHTKSKVEQERLLLFDICWSRFDFFYFVRLCFSGFDSVCFCSCSTARVLLLYYHDYVYQKSNRKMLFGGPLQTNQNSRTKSNRVKYCQTKSQKVKPKKLLQFDLTLFDSV